MGYKGHRLDKFPSERISLLYFNNSTPDLVSVYSSPKEERNLNAPEQKSCSKNIEMTKPKDSETLTMHHYEKQETLYF